MGRKTSSSKLPDKSPLPENTKPSLGTSEPLPGISKPSLDRVDAELENPNSPSSVLKHQIPSVEEEMIPHHERSPEQEQGNAKPELQEKYSTFQRKKTKNCSTPIRRSKRIKTAVVHTSNHDFEPYIEGNNGIDNEKAEPDTQITEVLSEPEANTGEKSLEEKVHCILQRLEVLEKFKESMESKVDENIDLNETPSSASTTYRSLYVDSQKKLEALIDENRQLTGKLENALGKAEILEKQSNILLEVLEKLKDIVTLSSLAKSTEAAVTASTQAIQNACAAKRKRHPQES